MVFVCIYCGASLSTVSSLNLHQKRAKYCIKLQGENRITNDTSFNKEWKCECGKSFTWKTSLGRHKNTCNYKETHVVYQQQLFPEMMRVMDKVLDTLNDVARKPTTINTHNDNSIINLMPITNNYLEEESIKHLTEQIVMEGRQPEIAVKVFDGYILIADKSRKKIKYLDSDGNVCTNSRKLVQEFYRAIQTKNQELAEKIYKEIQGSVNKYIEEGRAGDLEFTQLLTTSTNIQDRLNAIKNVIDGTLDDDSLKLADDTIKHIIG